MVESLQYCLIVHPHHSFLFCILVISSLRIFHSLPVRNLSPWMGSLQGWMYGRRQCPNIIALDAKNLPRMGVPFAYAKPRLQPREFRPCIDPMTKVMHEKTSVLVPAPWRANCCAVRARRGTRARAVQLGVTSFRKQYLTRFSTRAVCRVVY